MKNKKIGLIIITLMAVAVVVSAFQIFSFPEEKGCLGYPAYTPMSEYDNTVITGAGLSALLNLAETNEYAVLIHNIDIQNNYNTADQKYVRLINNIEAETRTGEIIDKDVVFVNYMSVVDGDITVGEDGKIVAPNGLKKASDIFVETNEEIQNTVQIGSPEYIKMSSRYNAKLIKDQAGSTIGVICIEKYIPTK